MEDEGALKNIMPNTIRYLERGTILERGACFRGFTVF
jgi:hypothetical protein